MFLPVEKAINKHMEVGWNGHVCRGICRVLYEYYEYSYRLLGFSLLPFSNARKKLPHGALVHHITGLEDLRKVKNPPLP